MTFKSWNHLSPSPLPRRASVVDTGSSIQLQCRGLPVMILFSHSPPRQLKSSNLSICADIDIGSWQQYLQVRMSQSSTKVVQPAMLDGISFALTSLRGLQRCVFKVRARYEQDAHHADSTCPFLETHLPHLIDAGAVALQYGLTCLRWIGLGTNALRVRALAGPQLGIEFCSCRLAQRARRNSEF